MVVVGDARNLAVIRERRDRPSIARPMAEAGDATLLGVQRVQKGAQAIA
jgi:hypothetical protein